jgi:hypothetical protein
MVWQEARPGVVVYLVEDGRKPDRGFGHGCPQQLTVGPGELGIHRDLPA